MHSLVLDASDFFQVLIHIHIHNLQGLPVWETHSLHCPVLLGVCWKHGKHLPTCWNFELDLIRLTLDSHFSVLWALEPEDCFFFYFLLFPVIGKKKKKRFLLFITLLRNDSIKWCHWTWALTTPRFRHGCGRCAAFSCSWDLAFLCGFWFSQSFLLLIARAFLKSQEFRQCLSCD